MDRTFLHFIPALYRVFLEWASKINGPIHQTMHTYAINIAYFLDDQTLPQVVGGGGVLDKEVKPKPC